MTARLAYAAVTSWEVLDGYAAAHNMADLRTLPLNRFTAFVWYMMCRNLDEKGIERLRAKLWIPPRAEKNKPIPANSPWSAENEMKNLRALEASLGGKISTGPKDTALDKTPGSKAIAGRPRPRPSMRQQWEARPKPNPRGSHSED